MFGFNLTRLSRPADCSAGLFYAQVCLGLILQRRGLPSNINEDSIPCMKVCMVEKRSSLWSHFVTIWFVLACGLAQAQQRMELLSPDDAIRVVLQFREKLEPFPQGRGLYYSVFMDGRPIVQEGALGLEMLDQPPLAYEWVIKDTQTSEVDQTWQRVWGKSKEVRDHYRELALTLEENQDLHRRIGLVFRAYNDGVAFRYVLPKQETLKDFKITSESTWFCFTDNHTLWAPNYGGFVSPQESEFQQMALNQLESGEVYGLPVLVKVEDGAWAAITEANLNDWAAIRVIPWSRDYRREKTILWLVWIRRVPVNRLGV